MLATWLTLFFLELILRPSRWRKNILVKCQLIFNTLWPILHVWSIARKSTFLSLYFIWKFNLHFTWWNKAAERRDTTYQREQKFIYQWTSSVQLHFMFQEIWFNGHICTVSTKIDIHFRRCYDQKTHYWCKFSWSRRYLQVNSQLHSSIALSPEQEPPVPIV
jgi:hypothetical protein